MLFVDEFDPHEPFDTPEPWAGRYDPEWEGELLIWPPYDVGAVEAGRLSEREGRQIRANYGAKLSMIDHWVGEVFDAPSERGLWESTAVIVCTDHGHYLGEKDIWGKPGVMQYEPLGHIPLLVHWPGVAGGTSCGALTTNVDINATLADVFGVPSGGVGHGAWLVLRCCAGSAAQVREWAIGGVYGNWVQVTDGHRKYARGASGDNFPLSMWSNRWSTMPVHGLEDATRLPPPDRRARLDFMPGSDVPVIRQPFEPGDRLPFWVGRNTVDAHFLYDLDNDPGEDENLVGEAVERDMVELLRHALVSVDAPGEQLERLGIAMTDGACRRRYRRPTTEPFVLPRIPASSGALIFDERGRLLIANPTYKAHWTIPGGIMEADGETPWEACRREVRRRSASTSQMAGWSPSTSCGRSRQSRAACGSCSIAASCPIRSWPPSRCRRRSSPSTAWWIRAKRSSCSVGRCADAWAALAAETCVYLEDGRPV